jgi:cytochrome b561
MSPRLIDWSLALTCALAFMTGVVSLVSGHPEEWLIFAAHGAAGLWLALLLWGKLRRVLPRLARPRLWDRRTVLGALAVVIVALALGTGIGWVVGGTLYFLDWGLLNWHILLGFALTVLIASHMLARAKPLRRRDVSGRRQMLRGGLLLGGAMVLWPAQQVIERVVDAPGSHRRFTGSREAESYAGNAFPATSWVADAPRPISPTDWRLRIDSAVAVPRTFSYDEMTAAGDELVATLDCTGGFCSAQRWGGMRVGRLLDGVALMPGAAWVSFLSVTGYRWSLPLEEARAALLATHVSGEPLSHDHGAPLRLVAPDRRGFQWVKWVVRVEVRTLPDPGELIAIHSSSLTPEGRGER